MSAEDEAITCTSCVTGVGGTNSPVFDEDARPSRGAVARSGSSLAATLPLFFRAFLCCGGPFFASCCSRTGIEFIEARLGRIRPTLALEPSCVVSLPIGKLEGGFVAAKRSSNGSLLCLWWVSRSGTTTFLVRARTEGFLARLISTVNDGTARWGTLYSQHVTGGREHLGCALGGVQQPWYYPANKTDPDIGGSSRIKMPLRKNIAEMLLSLHIFCMMSIY
jgi:hypothetical protein